MADEAIPETTPTTTETAAAAAPVAAPAVEAAAVDPLDAGTLLGGDAKPADAAPVEGAPEKYELTAPEGTTLDPADVEAFEPIARELGLSNENANKLLPVAAAFAQRLAQKSADEAGKTILSDVLAQRAAWATASQADPEIGGSPEHHAASMAVAAKALDRFGGPEFRTFLNETGLGNHPDMIRFAFRAGQSIAEDSEFHRADAAAKPVLTREQKYYPKPATT